MAQMVTEAEWAAQRRTVAVVRIYGALGGGGLSVWCEYQAGEGETSAADVSRDLGTLRVPHEVVIAFRPPRPRELRRRKGQEVRVAFRDLPRLVRWVPSLQQQIDELPAETSGFTFTYFEPRTTGMAVLVLSSLAADWLAWTPKQAAEMGLLCAECSFDLRTCGTGQRPAYNIPRKPDRHRLLCGNCCGEGLAELERWAAAGEPGER